MRRKEERNKVLTKKKVKKEITTLQAGGKIRQ